MFSLKNPENGYWSFVCEFTHPEVKKDVDDNPDVHSVFDKGRTKRLFHHVVSHSIRGVVNILSFLTLDVNLVVHTNIVGGGGGGVGSDKNIKIILEILCMITE